MEEVWIVHSGEQACQLIDGVLWLLNSRSKPTAFTTKQSAERAIEKTLQYAKHENLSWGDEYKAVRFSRG